MPAKIDSWVIFTYFKIFGLGNVILLLIYVPSTVSKDRDGLKLDLATADCSIINVYLFYRLPRRIFCVCLLFFITKIRLALSPHSHYLSAAVEKPCAVPVEPVCSGPIWLLSWLNSQILRSILNEADASEVLKSRLFKISWSFYVAGFFYSYAATLRKGSIKDALQFSRIVTKILVVPTL